MTLTDKAIQGLKPAAKSFRSTDGQGLYLEIFPNGSKLWRLKYRFAGKEKRLALGAYPSTGLAEARRRRGDARRLLEEGVDPGLERKRQKAAASFGAENTFAAVADEFIVKMEKEGLAPATIAKARWFSSLLQPAIGQVPVSDVDPHLLLGALRRIEGRGNCETAKKTRSFASRVFRFAVATARSKHDPASLLQGALAAPITKNYAAILDPNRLGELLRAIEGYGGFPSTKFALRIAPHVFVRPGELRYARWSEIDLAEAVWRIPASRMKARRQHAVPLSSQVIRLFAELHTTTGAHDLVFPSMTSNKRPISENTLNSAFRRMGFSKEEVTAHGLRATASTFLNESGLWTPDAIERALAHGPSNAIRGVYHRGTHWPERIKIAQWWSDRLDEWRNEKVASSM